jgi:DNA ligase-1
MRALAVLTEELESRPGDADRVDALARHLRAVGRHAGALAGEWLVAGARTARPVRLTQAALAEAARALAVRHGMAAWLFDVGQASSVEAAEAIAMLLPWPDGLPSEASRPALADWLVDWAAAASEPTATRALAIAAAIARLDDAIARRWAVRAVCGLAKAVVDEWQWQRAWALAFDVDAQAVAWWWHRRRDGLLLGAPVAGVPRAHTFAVLEDAEESCHDALLAAWRGGELHAEPRWNGVRVHIVRRGADVAVWQRDGRLLNARLPPAWLEPERWPEQGVLEAVLLACVAGRVVALAEAAAPRKKGTAPGSSLHLVLVDWHGAAQAPGPRRAQLLARWPAPAEPGALPAIFTTPGLPASDEIDLARRADAARADGWSGLVLRHATSSEAWVVRAAVHRIRAVLQYVPGDALAASATAALALAFVDCGFALWNRVPRSEEEQRAAMTASMSGEFIAPPPDAPAEEALRLLPLARLPLALPDDELLRLHAWLRANVGQRFGGVHAVVPALVFELGFVEARPSGRHKIGATLAGARVLRWVHDAPAGGAQLAGDLFPDASISG